MDSSRPDTELMRSVLEKLSALEAAAARSGGGVVIEIEPEPLVLPPLPGGMREVFGSLRSIGGNLLRFDRPAVVASAERLDARPRREGDPFADAAVIGTLRFALPEFIAFAEWEDVVHVDLLDGSVFYCDSDEYLFRYENPGEGPPFERLTGSVAEFFDEFVLGWRYAELVARAVGEEHALVLGTPAVVRDRWLELLLAAGLV
ncbi:hypothetical protein [Glycomyces terrestris]|uniref:Uncharacterized protein n=1 Tax=Glycomyces terrestris TaxID=2493553 RepID=A0A426UYN8_9ACTN|nr:hypothetical protein [Glycomyces terrestris]RRR99685.1 hypothetical protein EIW28_13470 [Glycomyces terrestris]